MPYSLAFIQFQCGFSARDIDLNLYCTNNVVIGDVANTVQ